MEMEMGKHRRIYKYDKSLGKMVEIKAVPVLKGCHWPMLSETAAIRVEDVKRSQKMLASNGVQTDYEIVVGKKTENGQSRTAMPIFRSRQHKRDHFRAIGLADPDATSRFDAYPIHARE
jgi:hypothetical protein